MNPNIADKYKYFFFDELESSNEKAKELIANGQEFPFVVQSAVQTKGKGRNGRKWVSAAGNLFLTIAIKPANNIKLNQLPFVAAIAIGETVRSYVKKGVKLNYKWPNDILLDDKKVSGILLESSINGKEIEYILIGIGINILSSPKDVIYPAASLNEFSVNKPVLKGVTENLIANFEQVYMQWFLKGFDVFYDLWVSHAKGIGESIKVKTLTKEYNGVFKELEFDGSLVLETENQQHKITAGDVFFA